MSIPAFAPRLAFVDVETTGSSPTRERVTEIGVVRVDVDGESTRIDEWSTLVNPGVPIPPEIEWLTGITNEMVRNAPRFEQVAQDLIDRLDGAVFVAHNARFDYGFLRAEFARSGLAFHAKTLCTVRLSRVLYPDRAPHTLDALRSKEVHRKLTGVDAGGFGNFGKPHRVYPQLPHGTALCRGGLDHHLSDRFGRRFGGGALG